MTIVDPSEQGIPLADLITTLRQELDEAQSRGAGQRIRFTVDRVELELKVAVTRKAKGTAGIKFWVVQAGGELEGTGAVTHTFKLSFTPELSTGGTVVVAADAPGARLRPDSDPDPDPD